MRGQRLELVGRGGEGQAGDRGDLGGDRLGEAHGRVEAGADRGAALRQLHTARQRLLDALDAVIDLLRVAGELLAQRQRRGVLHVGAADLDDVRERLAPCRSSALCRCASAGMQPVVRSPRPPAMCMAVGKVSFDDWPRLTWSLGWTGFFEPTVPPSISIARLEITSLAFMLDWVPEPVCQTTQREVVVELAVDHLLGRGDDGAAPAACRAGRAPCWSRPRPA